MVPQIILVHLFYESGTLRLSRRSEKSKDTIREDVAARAKGYREDQDEF